MEGKIMKHTKLLVVVLLVALFACLAVTAMADDPCPHLYMKEESYTAPTCLGEGVQVLRCSNPDCDYVLVRTIPALGHSFPDTPTTTIPATCGQAGRYEYKCNRCEHVKKIDIPATGNHDFQAVLDPGKAPTCTGNGIGATMGCIVCGKKMADPVVIPPLGHVFTENAWVVNTPATCAREGVLQRTCNRCGYIDTMKVGKADHHTQADGNDLTPTFNAAYNAAKTSADITNYTTFDYCILPFTPATCTTNGCTAVIQCPTCGAKKGGEVIPAFGHDVTGVAWTVKTPATCASAGELGRRCKNCNAWIETQNVGKAAYHTDWNGNALTNTPEGQFNAHKKDALESNYKTIETCILPATPAGCVTDGCYAVFQCPTCGKTVGGGKWAASGHNVATWTTTNPTCTADGKSEGVCSNPNCEVGTVTVKLPAYGHSATWTVVEWPTASKLGRSELKCARCGEVLGVQYFSKNSDAPTGTVNTGVSTSTTPISVSGKKAAEHEAVASTVVKTTTSTAKSTTKTSTAKTSTSSTKAAAAPATTETKKVATVAAVVAAPAALAENQAQLVADKHLYVVKNVAGEEIVLTVNVVDGKITVEANLAEGESLVLYANAEAVEAPTAENTLVLTANEAVELPEAFANAILAVVKTESLPAAVAAK